MEKILNSRECSRSYLDPLQKQLFKLQREIDLSKKLRGLDF